MAPFSWQKRIIFLEIEDRHEEVIELCLKRIEQNGIEAPYLYEIITRNYRNLNQIDKAVEYIDKAKKINHISPQIKYEEGLVYFLKKNYPKSRQLLETALDRGYDTVPLQIHLGKVYYQLGLLKKAEECFNNVLMIYPNEGSVHFLMGIVLKDKTQYKEAKESFLQAIKCGSDQKEEHLALAEIFTREGEWEMAINKYKDILKIYPDNFIAHYFLGLIYEIQGHESDAINELVIANKINPNDDDTKIRLTKLLES